MIHDPNAPSPPCHICGKPMHGYQRRTHLTCCAAAGGATPVCNPRKTKDKPPRTVCAHCQKEAA